MNESKVQLELRALRSCAPYFSGKFDSFNNQEEKS